MVAGLLGEVVWTANSQAQSFGGLIVITIEVYSDYNLQEGGIAVVGTSFPSRQGQRCKNSRGTQWWGGYHSWGNAVQPPEPAMLLVWWRLPACIQTVTHHWSASCPTSQGLSSQTPSEPVSFLLYGPVGEGFRFRQLCFKKRQEDAASTLEVIVPWIIQPRETDFSIFYGPAER